MTKHQEPAVDIKLAQSFGLSQEEFDSIQRIMGRTPSYTELGIFSVLWSEHCSYKNSKPLLKLFPTRAPQVLQGPGENAGIVDIGDGLGIAMKVESHNHPSAIEPYQGAATGIGGILRDIFTMGARPIALMDPLYFGSLDDAHVRHLFSGVVSGIADYGNCVGIPTVGGSVVFDESYTTNPLVNVMCLGLVENKKIMRGFASGPGNLVIAVGATTGRDGIHGATFASEELSEASSAKRPSVQIGDPFTKKLLLEATLELIESGLAVGIQDMGAAGLTSSSIEMASRAGTGLEMDMSQVPLREKGMTPYEIMLSESQERMVVVAPKENYDQIKAIFDKWELHCSSIGVVTNDGKVRIKWKDEVFADIPVKTLVDEAPVYQRESNRPGYLDKLKQFIQNDIKEPKDHNKSLNSVLSAPTIASKRWVYQQYDHQVRTNTAVLPGSDAAVLRIRGTNKAIGITTDCNGRYCYLNPFNGGAIAVAEAARNLACSGARPLGLTDCLNFGNPYKPEVFYQMKQAVEGLAQACKVLEVPVISGNVSLYNESLTHSVYPTPLIGMVGLIEDLSHITTQWFKQAGDVVFLAGDIKSQPDIGGSEYLKAVHGQVNGDAPAIDLEAEKKLHDFVRDAIRAGLVRSAHDCSEGGLAVALAECCFTPPLDPLLNKEGTGLVADLSGLPGRGDFKLFAETQTRIILSSRAADVEKLEALAKKQGVDILKLGTVGGEKLVIKDLIDIPVAEARKTWEEAIPNMMK
ncbi:MAG: phosphoribosylformylglycinamidine synthase II [Candidatus Edwardsbacteria bacterium RIFOXYD12_FULL_50_11]|uniref:Phosphoribosylformylglycinamidine synthase subunit PurL n=1 Tax=Candidatus Edwardsbacteria bacterium GWF2_54_11 TaxID=1817851 RepID=A0A1F5R232_9BACT|nr:MAG: phosphoribosylformylglycinamidine synthase II [Candidatus Edwardsbacteria bacterium RifOxyC12_full_54_24]OGF08103.1 MAG: phosphoribosylformylglycinamidine synthase II [Candidatus Edwardsbacteria bacterium GWF2_54_11]OGF08620.1 MAG: phosphoribosylformylglycinamidine synthase II [Candidatus Edwardsbacteria bacterium RifOxyA12_full_54_48]OGF11264.1 MAG: phosphoribosylformylglycinamidine synthase II [Candidatus Edwardsbacteria bacterium GWE2_54_12]OGF16794.1 MAG: phosphoribosylformylglycina